MENLDRAFWLRVLNAGLSAGQVERLRQSGTDRQALTAIGLTPAARRRFLDDAALARAETWLEETPDAWLLTLADADYPEPLRAIADPPPVMMGRGRRALLQGPLVAIVGARHATREGLEHAHRFAAALSGAGLTVVSGLAHGIDAAAHEGALTGPGSTVAVIGTGIDRVYPAANRALAHRIVECGAILSPFPLGAPPKAAHFPQRNRIVSGLSLGVLVVEAAEKSGSLITARLAMEQGREVFAIPGSIHNPLARGCHRLIRQGARLTESPQDILEELAPHLQHALALSLDASGGESDADAPPEALSPAARQLWSRLDFSPRSLDVLAQSVEQPVATLQAALLELELAGCVERLPGGFYKRIS